MEHAENELVAMRFKQVSLLVAKDNPDALRFYQRIGYETMGSEEGYWSYTDHLGREQDVHEPSWVMGKELLISN